MQDWVLRLGFHQIKRDIYISCIQEKIGNFVNKNLYSLKNFTDHLHGELSFIYLKNTFSGQAKEDFLAPPLTLNLG